MNELLDRTAALVPLLLVGAAILLGFGSVVLRRTTSPVHRQRIGELTIVCVLAWCLLACVPVPRLLPDSFWNPIRAGSSARRIVPSGTSIPVSHLSSATGVDNVPIELPAEAIDSLLANSSQHVSDSLNHVTSRNQSDGTSWIAMAYLAGAAGCLLWISFGYVLLLRLRWFSRDPEEWLQQLFKELSEQAQAKRARLLISTSCRRAVSWGAIWPVVVLPAALCQRTNERQLRMVLLHELGHTSQGDAWGNLLLTLAFPLLYVQPLFWWLRSQVRMASELIADDFAARQSGKETYALELIALAKSSRRVGELWGVTGVVSSPSQFYRRMQMLLARETPLSHRPTAAWRWSSICGAGLAVMIAAALFGVQPVDGKPSDDKPSAADTTSQEGSPPQSRTTKSPGADNVAKPQAETVKPTTTLHTVYGLEDVRGSFQADFDNDGFLDVVVANGRVTASGPGSLHLSAGEDPNSTNKPDVRVNSAAELLLQAIKGETGDEGRQILIRATNDNNVEMIIIQGDDKNRIFARTFTLKGNKSADDQKAAKPAPNVAANNKPVNSDRVISEQNGEQWLEGLKFVDQEPKMVERHQRDKSMQKALEAAKQAKAGATTGMVEATKAMAGKAPPTLAESRPAMERSHSKEIDLISLATSCADALSAVEAATDPASAERAKRKLNLLRRIAEVEFKSVSDQCSRLETLYKAGAIAADELTDVQSRRNILKEILETAGQLTGDGRLERKTKIDAPDKRPDNDLPRLQKF